jgi:hypothetical protein
MYEYCPSASRSVLEDSPWVLQLGALLVSGDGEKNVFKHGSWLDCICWFINIPTTSIIVLGLIYLFYVTLKGLIPTSLVQGAS